MPDYKEMYLKMVRATEKAIRQIETVTAELIAAQRECEEMYLAAPEPKVVELMPGEAAASDEEGSAPGRGGTASGGVLSLTREKVPKERA